jgi:uncharacterized membrane protein YbhN (UPF0104 family)
MNRLELKRKILWLVLLFIGIGITLRLIQIVGYRTFWDVIHNGQLWNLAASMIVFVLTWLLRGYKWFWAARSMGYEIDLSAHYVSYFPQAMFSAFTPFRSGDLAAPWLMDQEMGKSRFLSVIMLERAIEFGVLFVLGIVFGSQLLVFLGEMRVSDQFVPDVTSVFLLVMILVGIVAVTIGLLRKKIGTFLISLQEVATIRLILFFFLTGIIAVIGDFTSVYFMVRTVEDIRLLHSFAAQIVSLVFSTVTFVPMGIGTGTISYSYVMKLLGYNEQFIIIGSLLSKLISITLLLLLGAGGLLWRSRIQRR